jgi:TIR domain
MVADIFVSYTSSDRDWAMWIAAELKALGHKPHVHEWEIGAGDDIYAWMETRIDKAHHMLCVVSEEYLKAPYSTLE